MRFQLINPGPPQIFAVVLEKGDETVGCLKRFALQHRLYAAQLTAIGAFERGSLGFYDLDRKDYLRNDFDEQVELVSLIGDVSLDGDEPKVHAHVTLGRRDGSTLGGHLLEGVVRPTLEVIVTESPGYLRRQFDPESGLSLIRPTQK
jgi:predicted DNA-binding protein with PD1-like motif